MEISQVGQRQCWHLLPPWSLYLVSQPSPHMKQANKAPTKIYSLGSLKPVGSETPLGGGVCAKCKFSCLKRGDFPNRPNQPPAQLSPANPMGSNSPLHLRTQRGAATAADKKSFHFHKNEIQTRRASGFANDVFTQRRWGKKKKKDNFCLMVITSEKKLNFLE